VPPKAASDVTAQIGFRGSLTKASLLDPVTGIPVRWPGKRQKPRDYLCNPAGARFIAPGDGKVLFAGPYHKEGQVLILETAAGYDIVLAGLGA